jgi:hypothetical protein
MFYVHNDCVRGLDYLTSIVALKAPAIGDGRSLRLVSFVLYCTILTLLVWSARSIEVVCFVDGATCGLVPVGDYCTIAWLKFEKQRVRDAEHILLFTRRNCFVRSDL